MERLGTLPLDPDLIKRENSFTIVYTPLHGVGGVIIKPMLARLGFRFFTVAEQEVPDGRFPTVKSPNPENAEALTMAIALAEKESADLVIATDPDDDRMGIAARDAEGRMVLLTGNQIGSLLTWYRVTRMLELGILTPETRSRGVVIKTFVTTPLQNAIAERNGLRCVETLTGFKYNGAKLGKYESQIPAEERANYPHLPEATTRALRLKYSSLYVCGGEESYGYSGADFVRDKDGNGATVMIAEVAAYAKSRGLTLVSLMDEIYKEFGFYSERGESLTMEGAEGAAQIARLVASYAERPPTELDGTPVVSAQNFATDAIYDVEGDRIPAEAMLIFTLADHRRVAVRPSGTEPKIKYYLFAARIAEPGAPLTDADLAATKPVVVASLASLWQALKADADARLA
jgi:phosphoglucomutase